MKKTLSILALSLATTALGAESVPFHYDLPDSGLLPGYAEITAITRMGERHGGSDLSMQTYSLTVPLSDPRKSGWDDYMLNVQFDAKLTDINTGGTLDLEHDELVSVSVPVTIVKKMPTGSRLTMGMAPEIASDSGAIDHGLELTAYGLYTVKHNESFTYTLGVAVAPRFSDYGIIPVFGFEWRPSDDWLIRMKGYRLDALYQVSDTFCVGPFMAGHGGTWSVETPRGDRQFRVRSLVLGIGGEYNFAEPGQTKRMITFAVGSTVATTAQFQERSAGKHEYETHHYKPGLFISAGLDFRF